MLNFDNSLTTILYSEKKLFAHLAFSFKAIKAVFLKVWGIPGGGGASHPGEKGGGLIFGHQNFFPWRNQCSKWKKISASTPLFTYKRRGGGGGVPRDRNPPRTTDRGGGVEVEYRQPVTSAGTQEKEPVRSFVEECTGTFVEVPVPAHFEHWAEP